MHKLRPGVRSCTTFLLGCALCNVAFAQSIAVRLLNGKTGKPLSKVRVYIILGDPKHQHAFDLKTDREGNDRTSYSLRHTYISMRLMEGADIYQVAKNCRTSVEMIEKYYASHIKDRLDAAAINVRKRKKRSK